MNSEQLAVSSEYRCLKAKRDDKMPRSQTKILLTTHCSLLTVLCSLFPITRLLIFLTFFFFNISFLFCLDFSIRPKGFVSINLGQGNVAKDGNKRYSIGGGGELDFEIDLASVWPNRIGLGYSVGLETSALFNPLQVNNPMNVFFYSFGGTAGLYYFPASRLFTRIDGAVGPYLSARDKEKSDIGFFWRGGGEVGFRFSPGFIIAANAGWRQYWHPGKALKKGNVAAAILRDSGIYTGLTAQLTLHAGRGAGREGISASFDQYEELFPVFMRLYQTNPIGSVVMRNNENAEIRNLRLSFRAVGYTASEFPCGEVSIIQRGRSAELPLYADFSPEVLRFTDKGRILGELVIRYTFLGQVRETIKAITVATHNRNMIIEGDTAALAAFVSPTSPETLDFARFIAGLARSNNRITGHNQNMHYAIWLFEGLRASSIRLGETYAGINEAQFPAETLSYRSGTSRDIALLFAAGLESVGISSAFIAGNHAGEFLVAVSLGIGQSAAETLFNGMGRILVINDEVWLPLSMFAFNDGFMAAWMQGAAILDKIFSEKRNVDFVITEEAWEIYPPAPLPELGKNVIRTDNEAAASGVNRALRGYITQEIYPIINKQTGNNTAAGQNRLGILLTRAGRVDDGKAAYERAAGMGSVPAMTNRGNIALSENDLAAAEHWFRQALQRDPENRIALLGMDRISGNR